MKIHSNKLNHMRGVAEYMYQSAGKYGLNPDEAYVVGLLHDIGYINDDAAKRQYKFFNRDVGHEAYGALLLENMGLQNKDIFFAILYHGTSPKDTPECTRDNPWTQLLWEADMSIDKYGNRVGYDGRLSDIGHRYGFDSAAYKTASETVDYLRDLEANRIPVVFYGYDKDNDLLEVLCETTLEKAVETGNGYVEKVKADELRSSAGEPYDWVEVSIDGCKPGVYVNSADIILEEERDGCDEVERD